MIASFESLGAGGDSPLSDIVGARSWLGRSTVRITELRVCFMIRLGAGRIIPPPAQAISKPGNRLATFCLD
jgi:hypothetical protein